MLLCDVNILVYAHREDSESHAAYLKWLSDLVNSDETFGKRSRQYIRVSGQPALKRELKCDRFSLKPLLTNFPQHFPATHP